MVESISLNSTHGNGCRNTVFFHFRVLNHHQSKHRTRLWNQQKTKQTLKNRNFLSTCINSELFNCCFNNYAFTLFVKEIAICLWAYRQLNIQSDQWILISTFAINVLFCIFWHNSNLSSNSRSHSRPFNYSDSFSFYAFISDQSYRCCLV